MILNVVRGLAAALLVIAAPGLTRVERGATLPCSYSSLWGVAGEKWQAAGLLLCRLSCR